MIGIVLAAGAGRRLAPLTDDLPKTLLPVCGDVTILDLSRSKLEYAALGSILHHVLAGRPPYERPLVPILPSHHDWLAIHSSVSCPSGPSSR